MLYFLIIKPVYHTLSFITDIRVVPDVFTANCIFDFDTLVLQSFLIFSLSFQPKYVATTGTYRPLRLRGLGAQSLRGPSMDNDVFLTVELYHIFQT